MGRLRLGQDFEIGINNGTAAQTHSFLRTSQTSLEPRVARMLGRPWFTDPSFGLSRGLLTSLSLSGKNLLVNGGPGTTVNGTGARPGFPLRCLSPLAQTDRMNILNCAAGPTTPLEAVITYSFAQVVSGGIGTDEIDPDILEETLAKLQRGELAGELDWALGGGEITQLNAGVAQTITMRYKSPRQLGLGRFVCDLFNSDFSVVGSRDFLMTNISIAAEPLLGSSASIDLLGCSAFCTDEDGLYIGETVGADDEIQIDIAVSAAAPGVSRIIQHGWFTF